ncbi:MAG: FAD-dependent oxidoreductase [Bacteroidetes bacterium]|nr:FAD-dependent oxidoreductase [Bacteroidota bacterium]
MDELFDVMILGGGPAGLTAGIYASRAKLKTLVLNTGAMGGQMVLTDEIANYPGVQITKGYSLARVMKKQAKDFGCTIKSNINIIEYDLSGEIKSVRLDDGQVFKSHTIILTPGGRPRSLNLPGEEKFKGTGISYCATCDGDFFQDKEIMVIGGGNSALEEADSLTKTASKVTIVHQFDHFQAFEHAVKNASANPKINFIMASEPREFVGDENLEAVRIEQLSTGEISEVKVSGVFMFVGYLPNTEFLNGQVTMNERKEIIVDPDMKTSLPGVFAAGDCIAKRYRQVTTAVGEATIAALSAGDYLRTNANQAQ